MNTGPAGGGSPRVDGRTARALRTRAGIVDAHLALLRDGDMRPTGERIAERAGVSLRTLWTNFRDMETLFAATGRRLAEIQAAEHRDIPATLPLPERITAFCAQRARMLELLAPAARAAATREPFSPQLRQNRKTEIERVRAEIAELFATELDAAGPARTAVHDALLVASTYGSWAMTRDQLGHDVTAATGLMRLTVTAILTRPVGSGGAGSGRAGSGRVSSG
jgi:TetR/AcrR family transcriptional regulator, regulator of autoinduction and epiphytic fitness